MQPNTHAQKSERIALPRRLVPRPAELNMFEDPRYAYLEWLRMEANLLQIELGLGDAGNRFSPCGTFAHQFHFPSDHDWKTVPKPSTRADAVLRAAGVEMPE